MLEGAQRARLCWQRMHPSRVVYKKRNRIFVGFQIAFIPVLNREIGILKPNETQPRIGTIFVYPLLGIWICRSSEQKSRG
jgi:hypothetical protein